MSEEYHKAVTRMVTSESLKEALKSVGLGPNQIVEVHSSMKPFGYVVGGARTVVDALMDLVGEGGTLLMPSQTTDNSDPSGWRYPPLSPELWDEMRESMPAYDPECSDLNGMGSVVENFRHRSGTVCSCHPSLSYTAWGRYAKLLCNRQSLHFPLAEESPAARLYELKGSVLLLGAGFESCTCMHLAEYRTECRPIITESACVMEDGKKTWKKYLNLDIDSEVFRNVRARLDQKGLIRSVNLSGGVIQMFPAVAAIDEAAAYLDRNSVYNLYR
ncbi:MAG: AAC(3) family N-acetyltransferase [Bulleidia sp.]|nr:AAC(3) family N-acetyltransferase [Bulleidia sp.]